MPKRRPPRGDAPPAPLLGFGPAGWVLSALALALIAVLVVQYDLRHQLLRLITATLGADVMLWFVGSVLSWHSLDFLYPPPAARFGLVTMCCVFVAMQVNGRRFGWWAWVVVALAGLVTPIVGPHVMRFWHAIQARPPGFDPTRFNTELMVANTCAALVAAVMVGAALRSVRLGLTVAAFGLAGTHVGEYAGFVYTPLAWVWNPLLLAIMLVWAVKERRRWHLLHRCAVCGYDLRGGSGLCPECGAGRPGSAPTPGSANGESASPSALRLPMGE